ncbi:hypothetical protein DFO74_11216 [Chromohalobacter israelensis]|nr:hypothetical protein DFO74_11216 [Chromohalobacter salexigens]
MASPASCLQVCMSRACAYAPQRLPVRVPEPLAALCQRPHFLGDHVTPPPDPALPAKRQPLLPRVSHDCIGQATTTLPALGVIRPLNAGATSAPIRLHTGRARLTISGLWKIFSIVTLSCALFRAWNGFDHMNTRLHKYSLT